MAETESKLLKGGALADFQSSALGLRYIEESLVTICTKGWVG